MMLLQGRSFALRSNPPAAFESFRIVVGTSKSPAPQAEPGVKSLSRFGFLFEHDLFRKTGTHFSGSCFDARRR
jgi:hypothetical protein